MKWLLLIAAMSVVSDPSDKDREFNPYVSVLSNEKPSDQVRMRGPYLDEDKCMDDLKRYMDGRSPAVGFCVLANGYDRDLRPYRVPGK